MKTYITTETKRINGKTFFKVDSAIVSQLVKECRKADLPASCRRMAVRICWGSFDWYAWAASIRFNLVFNPCAELILKDDEVTRL